MKNNDSIKNWKIAKDLFEKYLDKSIEESLQEINNNLSIKEDVKSILVQLVNSQSDKDTIITDADLSFFEAINQETPDLSGKIIGNYELLKRIGKGGMSHVYEAKRQGSDIQKHLAIKVLHSQIGNIDETLKTLFIREQETLSLLDHPNIISFHHGGISNNGIPFLAMDFIENAITIDQYCIDNKLSNSKIIEVICQLANALIYAHSKLVVHKDIKPSNILIDNLGNIKIVDFGIAAFSENNINTSQSGDAINKTKNPRIFTPDYASPEQIHGHNITPSSDIFSLTAVLLNLLTQRNPLADFDTKTYDSSADNKHIQQLLDTSDLDNDIKNIIKKGLAVNIDNRYQSMQDFKNDLDNWLQLKPVTATNSTSVYRAKKFFQRHFGLTFLAATLMVSIILGIILVVNQKNQAQFEALKAKQVTNFLIESIQASDPDITKGKDVTVKEFLQNAKLKIQETSFQDIQLTTALEQTIGSALLKVGEYSDSEKLLSQALLTDVNNYTARLNLADLFLEQKQFNRALTELDFLNQNVKHLSNFQNNKLLQLRSILFFKQGKFERAISEITKAIKNNLKYKNITQLIQSKLIQTNIFSESGKQNEAVEILKSTLALSNKTFGELSSSSTDISLTLAASLSNITPTPWEEILLIYANTIKNIETLYGENHPKLAKAYLKYGFALKTNAQFEQAQKFANKAKKIALLNFGEDHMLSANINVLLSALTALNRNFPDAINQLTNALKVYNSHYGVNHFETNQVKTTLSIYLFNNKQPQQALAILKPLYISQKEQLGAENKATLYTHVSLLKALLLTKDYNQAIREGEIALKLSRKHLGPEMNITIAIQTTLADSYLHSHKYSHSIKLTEPLLKMDFVNKIPIYYKKIALILIKAYIFNNNIKSANNLIEKTIGKYYSQDDTKDAIYQELIELKLKNN